MGCIRSTATMTWAPLGPPFPASAAASCIAFVRATRSLRASLISLAASIRRVCSFSSETNSSITLKRYATSSIDRRFSFDSPRRRSSSANCFLVILHLQYPIFSMRPRNDILQQGFACFFYRCAFGGRHGDIETLLRKLSQNSLRSLMISLVIASEYADISCISNVALYEHTRG